MICHSFKHFLHGGFGIRQVCDIALYINRYYENIRWMHIYQVCHSESIEVFAAALLRIANKYLTLQVIPSIFVPIDTDEEPLLHDILSGGLYGTANTARTHSSNMTLDAVASDRQGKRYSGIRRSLFPKTDYLIKNYPYAKAHPILLPAAWLNRILNYIKQDNPIKSSSNTVRIGHERIELLKLYKIL